MAGSDDDIFGGPRERDVGERVGADRIDSGSARVHDTDRTVVACQIKLVSMAFGKMGAGRVTHLRRPERHRMARIRRHVPSHRRGLNIHRTRY